GNSSMSAPATNSRSAPRTTITRGGASSCCTASNTSRSSRHIARLSAFILPGLEIRKVAMPAASAGSSRMWASDMAGSCFRDGPGSVVLVDHDLRRRGVAVDEDRVDVAAGERLVDQRGLGDAADRDVDGRRAGKGGDGHVGRGGADGDGAAHLLAAGI